MSTSAFVDLAKNLEAKRLENEDYLERIMLSNAESIDHAENLYGNPINDDQEWPIDRWVRLQAEEEAGTRDRLTAPQNEIRKRKPKPKAIRKNETVDQLRAMQIDLVAEQTHLQKILQTNALIAQEEAQERLELKKIERQNAETTAAIAREEAQERLNLIKIQREIAAIELQNIQRERE